nr:MAG TPA: hypothetical protein [Caudoviricetes sp.]
MSEGRSREHNERILRERAWAAPTLTEQWRASKIGEHSPVPPHSMPPCFLRSSLPRI